MRVLLYVREDDTSDDFDIGTEQLGSGPEPEPDPDLSEDSDEERRIMKAAGRQAHCARVYLSGDHCCCCFLSARTVTN